LRLGRLLHGAQGERCGVPAGLIAALALLATAAIPSAATAQSIGGLDPAFGVGGFASVPDTAFVTDLALHRSASGDEGLVVAGGAGVDPSYVPILARFRSDGSRDPSFNPPTATTPEARRYFDSVLVDAIGRVLVVEGSVRHRSSLTIRRFTPVGDPDPNFGPNGTGVTELSFPDGTDVISPGEPALTSDGGLVFIGGRRVIRPGICDSPAFAVRLSSEGQELWRRDLQLAPDPIDPGEPCGGSKATAVVVQPSGRIVVAGNHTSFSAPYSNVTLVALTDDDGALDETFGEEGVATVEPEEGRAQIGNVRLATDAAGGLIVGAGPAEGSDVGAGGAGASPEDVILARLTADGLFDPNFGDGGMVRDAPEGEPAALADLAIDDQGRIVVAGIVAGRNMGLIRYLPDGARDTSFGNGGAAKLTNAPVEGPGGGEARAVAIRGSSIFAAGSIVDAGSVVAKVFGEPREDPPPSSGTDGEVGASDRGIDVKSVRVPKSLKKLFARGVKVEASCELDCRVVVELHVSQAVARRMLLSSTLVGGGAATASPGELTTIIAKIKRSARRAVKAFAGRARLKIRVIGEAP
jgi:uncharacterized delta-60 repeat protein